MRAKRAIWMGLYSSLFVVMIGIGILRLGEMVGEGLLILLGYMNIIDVIVISALFAFFYFRGEGIKKDGKEGALLGLVFIAISLIIELIVIFTYSFIIRNPDYIIEFYSNFITWASYLLILGATFVVGWSMGMNLESNLGHISHAKVERAEKNEEFIPARARKLVALITFILGLSILNYNLGLRIVGIIMLIISMLLFIQSTLNRTFSVLMFIITLGAWLGLSFVLLLADFSSLEMPPYQLYFIFLLMSSVISLIFLGWIVFSKN